VSDARDTTTFDVDCPHCHKRFSAPMLEGSAPRYRGFKCPHCKLFVPAEHAHDGRQALSHDPTS
jgi:hypothetical protein